MEGLPKRKLKIYYSFVCRRWAGRGRPPHELIGEVAGSMVNEMGDAMATASGGGEITVSKRK